MHAVYISDDSYIDIRGTLLSHITKNSLRLRSQVLRISRASQDAEVALARCRGVSHLFFFSAADASENRLAADLDGFQRLVSAARRAGCRLQQAHFSALTRPQHLPGD